MKSLLKEEDNGDKRDKASADEKGASRQDDLGPGEELDDDLAVLPNVGVLQLGRKDEAGAGGDGVLEGFVVVLEGGDMLVEVLEGVPAVEDEEGEEADLYEVIEDHGCDL